MAGGNEVRTLQYAEQDLQGESGLSSWPWLDKGVLAAIALFGVVVMLALISAPHFFLPSEDAVILYQYSHNLAHHGAITYYAGGPHAEGATDFAWMVLVAAAVRLGVDPFVFSSVVNFCALPLLALALLRLGRIRVTLLWILVIAGVAGMTPQILAAGLGFAVLPDALLLVLLTLAVQRERTSIAALLGLTVCLFRPDGVLFAVPLLGSLLLPRACRKQRTLLVLLLFVVPGLAYFAWRAHYFGSILPLPFLVKSDAHRAMGLFVAHSFWQSLKYLLFLTALLLPVFVGRPFDRFTRTLFFGTVLVPTLFFWTMRLDQNVGDRFFYYLPLSAAMVVALSWSTLPPRRRRILLYTGLAAWLVLLLGPLLREVRSFRDYQFQDVQAISQELGHLPMRGSMITTEAGFLAYGSGWVAYDAWGLNTADFARHPIQAADVAALKPDLIVIHPNPSDSCVPVQSQFPVSSNRTWAQVIQSLVSGAQQAGPYQLWLLSYGSPFYRQREHWGYGEGNRECFLVRESSPLAKGITDALERHHAVAPPKSIAMEQGHSH